MALDFQSVLWIMKASEGNPNHDEKGRFSSGESFGGEGDKALSDKDKKQQAKDKKLQDKIDRAIRDMKMKQRFIRGRSAG